MDKQHLAHNYDEYTKAVYKYLICLTNNTDLAEELTQETFYQAVKGIDQFRGDCKVTVWLCQIAKRLWYKELEKRKKSAISFEDLVTEPESDHNMATDYWIHLDTVQLFKELHKFDEKTKEVMFLRLTSVLSFKEIGEILGESETWARVTFYRGKQKLVNNQYISERDR